jgi:phosphoesterase RecJ-like protein
LREQEKGLKISLRSNEYVNVAEICMIFGGGGHIRAAGANTSMSFEEAKRALIREIEKRLK